MKKILIYARENELRSVGGPSGYLFNIKDSLFESSTNKNFRLSFLQNKIQEIKRAKSSKRQSKITNFIRRMNSLLPIKAIITLFIYKGNVEIYDFDIVHFHSTHELFSNRHVIKDKVVVLQSHSPVPPHKEIYEGNRFSIYARVLQPYLAILRTVFSYFDNYAFKRADYIIFPTEFSMTAYLKDKRLGRILNNKKDKIHFVISGILDPIKDNENLILKDQVQITFGYLGRHNFIKGYDRFVKVMGDAIQENTNLNVIVGGSINKRIQYPESVTWNELGWINQKTFFNSIDVLVLPNRETYFDLVLLEALAYGKVVLISNTGGNKYFLEFRELINVSLFFFDSEEEFKSQINIISQNDKMTLSRVGMKNRELFLNNFQAKNMLDDYYGFLNQIMYIN